MDLLLLQRSASTTLATFPTPYPLATSNNYNSNSKFDINNLNDSFCEINQQSTFLQTEPPHPSHTLPSPPPPLATNIQQLPVDWNPDVLLDVGEIEKILGLH